MEWKDNEEDTQTENSDIPLPHVPLKGSDPLPGLRFAPSANPWGVPAALRQSFGTDEQEEHGNRKRNRQRLADDNTLEDIMGQITSKLNNLSTGGDRTDSIAAFLEVLGCSNSEAEFYLDSSMWDIQTAVVLFLENNPHPATSFARYNTPQPFKRYCDREVAIDGLPEDWAARVNPSDGTVVFVHIPTGHRQAAVPPGYADEGPVMLDMCQGPGHVFGTDSEYFREEVDAERWQAQAQAQAAAQAAVAAADEAAQMDETPQEEEEEEPEEGAMQDQGPQEVADLADDSDSQSTSESDG